MIPIRDDAPRFGTPFVNYFLMAANTLVFLYERLLLSTWQRNRFEIVFGFIPVKITALINGVHHISVQGIPLPVTLDTALLPVLTCMFLHASWPHLIFNMWGLWIFGDNVEDYLGHIWYLAFYLFTGLAGTILHYLLNSASGAPTVGASGAIAGIMGAYLILYPSARVLTLVPLLFFFTFIQLPAWLVLGFWFVVQFLSGTAAAIAYSNQTAGGVAVWAHVGGFVAGASLIKLFPRRPQRYRLGNWYS